MGSATEAPKPGALMASAPNHGDSVPPKRPMLNATPVPEDRMLGGNTLGAMA